MGGFIYPNFLCPTHIFFIIFFFLNRETHFGRCPMLPSPLSNTKHSVDQPCTHDIPSSIKHSVDLYHALTPMSCDVLVHNTMQSCHCSFIPCYIYVECYMCMPTHASFGHLYQKAYKFQIYHIIQAIISIHTYIDITRHYYSCDAPKLGGPLTTRQPAEYSWMSGYPTPLMKIGQSLLCTGSSTQGTTCPNNQQ